MGISRYEAGVLLTIRVNRVQRVIKRKMPWTQCAPFEVRNVLVNMVYQMGYYGGSKFKNTLKHLKAEEYGFAAMEMLDSKWAKQTPHRAKRLADRIHALQPPIKEPNQ